MAHEASHTDAPTELAHLTTEAGIATLTLDSPANRNALSAQLVAEVAAHLATADADPTVRAVILTHTGGTFCAGNDLKEAAAEGGPQASTERLLVLLRQIVDLGKPVIAVVDGHVRAGGLGLVGACDIALAGERATFAFNEVRLGLAPSIISLTTQSRLTDRAAARYYLTGETFGSLEAERIGLVTEATDDLPAARATLEDALRACSPQGLAETKPLTTRAIRATFDSDGQRVLDLSARLFASEEAAEGMRAFAEKRPPRWVTTPDG
ncbi:MULTISPECIES: enoyl-CoA hydratase family protein [unclassified Janibacter]|uniref:enoyl-CoA hydratase family protein n=1 Tax=unclassified Janibacter TaxID=2649294 RepID=UPI003D05E7F6